MKLIKPDQARKQPADGKSRRAGYCDCWIGSTLVTQLVAMLADLSDTAGNCVRQRPALLGRERRSGATHKQAATDPFLDQFHMLADRALRHAEFFGGTAEALQTDDRLKGAQGDEGKVWQHIRHPNVADNELQIDSARRLPLGWCISQQSGLQCRCVRSLSKKAQ